MRTYRIYMIPGKVGAVINASQYDYGYEVQVTLYEGSVTYQIPSGASIRVEGTKSDAKGFSYECRVANGIVYVPIQIQMTAVQGDIPCELVVYKDGLRVGSCNFILAVEESALDGDTDISETDIPAIIAEATEQMEAAASSASQAAASATRAASSAASAETAKDAAMDAAQDAIDAAQELQTAIQFNAALIHETASGAVASFADGADNVPMKSVIAEITPVQDLNGYSNPWPSGGGKNLLDDSKRIASSSSQSITFGQTVGYGTPSVPMKAGTYTYTVYFRNGASGQGYMKKEGGENTRLWALGGNRATITLDEDALYSFWIYNSAGIVSDDVNAQIEVGTTSTDYAPYSNICPITGRTGLTVTAASKNLAPNYAGIESTTSNGITFTYNDDGSVTLNGTATASAFSRAVNGIASGIRRPFGRYKKSVVSFGSDHYVGVYVQYQKSDSNWATVIGGGIASGAFTLNEDYPLAIRIAITSGTTLNNYRFEPYIYPESISDTTWVSPSKTEIPITWESSAGTVYGGTLDVVSGVLTVGKGYAVYDGSEDESWNWQDGGTYKRVAIPLSDVYNPGGRVSVQSNAGTFRASGNDVGTIFTSGTTLFYYPDASITSLADYKTWLASNNLQVVYPLATPQTYQLTPTEVRTILGGNTIYTDAGSVTVEYIADTKLYIDNKIAELQALVLEN